VTKPLTADTAAVEIIRAGQPVKDFNAAANVKQEPRITQKPLPAALARSLGQDNRG
jgi:hypothetical protein